MENENKDQNLDPKGNEQTPPGINEKEIQSKIDSEVDRRIAKMREKWEQEKEAELAERERLAKLSAAEREKEQLSKREKQLQEREQQLRNQELTNVAKSALMEKELPSALADALVTLQDENVILQKVDEIKTIWDNEINEAIKARARQQDPQRPPTQLDANPTKSIAEIARKKRIIK